MLLLPQYLKAEAWECTKQQQPPAEEGAGNLGVVPALSSSAPGSELARPCVALLRSGTPPHLQIKSLPTPSILDHQILLRC